VRTTSVAPAVYSAIANVARDVAASGIAKTRRNVDQKYQFRGIDDVYNALAPLLPRHGLVVVPRMLARHCTERQSRSGGALFNVVVEAEFDFVSTADGSTVTARAFGEAMDSADKATNKAMSAAYKYTAFQTFCIPTEGDNDADASTPDVGRPAPNGFEAWWQTFGQTARTGYDALATAWREAPVEFRAYAQQAHAESLADLKAAAKEVA
jgi:hypothetical protein